MTQGFVAGLIAGYGVAIPVGAIAVLIIDKAIRRGFRLGASAGAGAATADFLYALVAILAGSAIAVAIQPLTVPLRLVAAGVLVAIAIRGLLRLPPAGGATHAPPPAGPPEPGDQAGREAAEHGQAVGALATYAQFLGLTLLNPLTIIYFAALVLGLPALETGPGALVAFAIGALVASLSWQLLIAGFGALLHHRMPAGARRATSIVGSVVVLLLGLRILVEALAQL